MNGSEKEKSVVLSLFPLLLSRDGFFQLVGKSKDHSFFLNFLPRKCGSALSFNNLFSRDSQQDM